MKRRFLREPQERSEGNQPWTIRSMWYQKCSGGSSGKARGLETTLRARKPEHCHQGHTGACQDSSSMWEGTLMAPVGGCMPRGHGVAAGLSLEYQTESPFQDKALY